MREKILEFFEFLKSQASEEEGRLIVKSPSRFWKEAGLSNRRQAFYFLFHLNKKGLVKKVEGTRKFIIIPREKIELTPLEKEVFLSLPQLVSETPFGLRVKEKDIPLPEKKRERFIEKLEKKEIIKKRVKTDQGLVFEVDLKKFALFSKAIEIVQEEVEKRIKTKEEIQAEIARLEREIDRLKWILENYDLLVKEISE